jgi:hypothetical protein
MQESAAWSRGLLLVRELAAERAASRRYAAWRRRYPVASLILIALGWLKVPVTLLLWGCVLQALATSPAPQLY